MNVLLAGMKHCGKSTAGAALARRWTCPFFDIDRLIETEHARVSGRRATVREIFKTRGEDYFTRIETQVVRALAVEIAGSETHHVTALGGPTPMNPDLQETLRELGAIVYLQMSADALFARVRRTGIPPFLHPADPAGHFAELYAAREPYYLRLADIVVNVGDLDVDAVVDRLVQRVEEYTHGR